MDIFKDLLFRLGVPLHPMNLLHCLLGVLDGALVRVIPGMGPLAAFSLLLPVTFHVTHPALPPFS